MKTILTILYTFCLTIGFGQSQNSDSARKAEKEQWLKEYEIDKAKYLKEISPALADSFHITAILKDFNLGGTCGSHKSAGGFFFKITSSDKQEFVGQTVMVIIQCASNDNNKFQKKAKYTLTVTPTRSPYDVLFIWENYKKYNYKNLYEIRTTKLN